MSSSPTVWPRRSNMPLAARAGGKNCLPGSEGCGISVHRTCDFNNFDDFDLLKSLPFACTKSFIVQYIFSKELLLTGWLLRLDRFDMVWCRLGRECEPRWTVAAFFQSGPLACWQSDEVKMHFFTAWNVLVVPLSSFLHRLISDVFDSQVAWTANSWECLPLYGTARG